MGIRGRVAGAGFAALMACVAAQGQFQLVGTKTAFKSDGREVVIERFDPSGKHSHVPILVAHGGAGPDSDWRKSGILEALTDAGYTVFMPHYFDSAGPWEPTRNDPQQFLSYIRTLNDAERYIMRQEGISGGKIGLAGFGLGGYLSLGLAEESFSHPPPLKSPEIKAVVVINAGMPEFAIPRMTKLPPVLILHGGDDPYIAPSKARDLEELLKKKSVPCEIMIYPHQGHTFDAATNVDANERAVRFLQAHVK